MDIADVQIWPLLAGLGLFLFGMYMLEEALKALAGRSFKKFLSKHTGHPIKAVLSGAAVTTVLQSSSMVSLLVMSFVGAGIIGLKNGIGMILGANLGTTSTGWLVSLIGFKLNIGTFILPFLAIGGLGIIFLKSEKLSNISKLLMGFSFMFMGLDYMKNGFEDFVQRVDFSFLHGKHPLLFVLFGTVLAASIRSSSASMMIFLSSLSAGIITFNEAAWLVIGSDLGTTVTALIGTIGANTVRKKAGWSQFYFNVFTALVAFIFIRFYFYILFDLLQLTDPLVGLVAFHSLFNLSGILLMLPFLNLFTRFIDRIISPDENRQSIILPLADPKESHAAIEALGKESVLFFRKALEVNASFFHLSSSGKNSNINNAYFNLKSYEAEIAGFYIPLLQSSLTEEEVPVINRYVEAVRNITLSSKDLKDIRHNLDQMSNSANDKLYELYTKICSNQEKLYRELKDLAENLTVCSDEELDKLSEMQRSFLRLETEELHHIYSKVKQSEMDIPSYLNMIREINNSNETLIRALRNLIVKPLPV